MADCTESVFDDTGEIIGDRAGNKESLEGITTETQTESVSCEESTQAAIQREGTEEAKKCTKA